MANEEYISGVRTGIDVYTQLLLNNNEVITQIIGSAYELGVRAGLREAARMAQQEREQEELPEELEPIQQQPTHVPPTQTPVHEERGGMFSRIAKK